MADDKKPQAKPVADAVLKTGTTTPETPAVKAPEVIVQSEKPADVAELFKAFANSFAEKFEAFTDAIRKELCEQKELLQEVKTQTKPWGITFAPKDFPSNVSGGSAFPPLGVAISDGVPVDKNQWATSGAEGGFATSEMTVTSKVFDVTCAACGPLNGVRAVNEKEACEKYKKHFGIINTPHPITAELKG